MPGVDSRIAKGVPLLNASSDANCNCLSQFRGAGLWDEGWPLRLHLGCGEQYFDGYINIDYPPSEHNIMQVKADVFANLLELDFPPASVDEIRLHHVFEHFSRVTALAMLIRWHIWLKFGGRLHIETPDIMGSAKTLLSNAPLKTKMGVVRHLAGDQAAAWAYHIDHWFPERFEHTLQRLGFDPVQTRSWSWPHEPYLANVEAMAIKSRNISIEEQLSNAEILLWESTVTPSEKPTYAVWMNQLKAALYGHVSMPAISMAKGAKGIVLSAGQTKERGKPVFINDWIREGDLVFDVGANLGAKTDVYLQKGASIVCFEPQPECARALREKYYGNPRVSIEERGLADKPGTMRLSICTEAHTISTFSDQWKTGRFAEYSWDKEVTVEVSTLDEMIERYGCPKYSKIDVEGFEFEVISGLTRKTPYLSFEFTIEFLENARKSVHHLERLGYQYFNVALGESPELVFPHWGCAEDLFHYIEQLDDKLLWGDIFVSSDSALSNGFTTGEAVGHTKQFEMAAISMGQSILSHNASRIPLPEIHDFNQRNRDVWVKAKAATVPSGARVLDIGAGTCPYRPVFAHCDYKAHDFKKYTGVKLGGGSEYGEIDYVSDITNIPVPDNSFDVILCTEVLEHIPEPIEALKEIARILRPGGRMLLTAPLGSGLHQLPYHFYGGFTPEWYKFIAQKLGFQVVEITPNGGFFRLLAQECARVLWTMPQHQHLHGSNIEFIRQLFGEWMPRYLFALDDRCSIDQFTVGYHIEMVKPSRGSFSISIPEEQKLKQTLSPKLQGTEINGIIFSKDRPLQLDGTLRSFSLHCKDPEFVSLKVLYTTSSPAQETLYQRLIREHPSVKFVKEQNFKKDLLILLEGPEMILFLVDDAIFIKDFSLMDVTDSLKSHLNALGFSLRLGRNTTYCYSLDKPQHLPAFQHLSPRILKYNWTSAEYDLGYPLEVSSSVYRAKEMQSLLARLPFSNPNTLEDLMDKHKNAFRESNPFLLCYEQSVAFCAPMNKVQTVASANRASGKVEHSADSLAKKFESGYQIDISSYSDFVPIACHQEVELQLQKIKPKHPKVSVIIPCYNQGQFLHEAVESVVNQTYQDWECIIVNDGSPDDTSEVARLLIAKYHDKQISLIEKQNGGLADARNKGIEASQGVYWLPLDSDDRVAPTYLEKAVRILEAYPDVGFVYSYIQHFGLQNDVYYLPDFDADTVVHTDNIACVCSLVRKSVWKEVGGYNINMKDGYEDWDFWVGCIEKGWKGYRIPEALFNYRKKEETMLRDANRKREQLIAFIVLNHPALYNERRRRQADQILQGKCPNEVSSRVLIACTHFWPSVGGLETIAENLGNQLVKLGYQVDAATWARPDRTFHLHRGMNILSLDISRTFNGAPLWVTQLRQLITSGKYKVCILLADPQNLLIWSIENADIPACTRVLIQPLINYNGYKSWRNNREFRIRLAAILKKATAAIALTGNGVEVEYMSEEGIEPTHLPNATDVQPASMNFRKQHGIPEEAFLVLHVANLWEVKNHLAVLRVLGNIPSDWRLVMIGYPSGEPKYVASVQQELRKHPSVLYIPGLPPENISAAMEEADVVILASKGEVSPVTILEAMNHHKPWVATPACGAVKDCAGGIIVPLDMFSKILQVLKIHPELRRALGNAGYQHWEACYSWPVVVKRWEELIETGRLQQSFTIPEHIAKRMNKLSQQVDQELLKLDEKLIQEQHSSPAPLVSVIIPTLNRPAMLDEAIQSVLRQTFRNFEIIVINDAGVDVGNVIEKYNQKRQIIYLQHNSNRGMAAARNTGIKVARGKYIAYLDDDDVYYPDHLETLINFLESSEYKVAYTDAFRAFQTFQNGQYITIKKDVPYAFDFDYERILKENFIPVLCIIHEKSCLDSVGMFDETLRAHEDWDLWMRMSRLFKFAHIKKVTCEFSWRQDGSSMTFGRKGDMETTRQIVFQRGQKLLKEGYYEPKIMKLQINADYEYKNIKPFLDSGRCQEAIVALEKIITSYPEYSPAHSDLGVLYYHQGNKEKSIIHHEKAVSLNPGNPIFLKNLGDFYYVELKKINEAIHLYQKVLAINPVDLETLLILGNIHAELKKFDEARSYYTKALEIDPSNGLARKCVKAFPRRNPFEAAEGDPEEDYREARILIQSGKEDKAIYKLEKLIHAHPRHALAHNDLGYLYYNRGERIKALAHYEKAVELNPENLTPMKNLADFYYVELKRIDEAIHLYEKVLSIHPMDGETLLILGNIHVELEKFLDAKAYYLRVLEIDPSNELASKMVEALERRQQEAGVDLDRENIAGKNLDAIAGLDSEGLQTRKESLRRKVSIIIPVFNKVEYTQKCLTAIFRNTENNLYEIVVVDNASTDGTGKYLKELGDKVKILTNRGNLGFAKACNQGAAIASSEYLLFLNNDTEPKPKWLEPLVNLLDGSVSVAAVGSKLLFPDGTIQHAGIAIIEDHKLPDPLVARHVYYRQPSDLEEANVPRQYQALTAACLLIRKDAFDEVKGFDEGYWNGYEDVDLCFKLRERGWRLIYQPESDVIHFESQSGKERFAKISKNISRLHEKWLGKVKPDLIIEKDGTAKETRAAGILPYSMVKRPEVILQSSHQQEKRISIVILTFNQLEYTKKCVESIRKHTPVPHEIIFVDNASKDGTIKWLKKLTQENPNFKLIENKKNLGFSKGCNQGITASSGEYILLLNNDILVTEGWLLGMLECINSSPDIGVVGPMTNNISGLQRVVNADYSDIDHLEGYAKAFREKNRYRRIPTRRIVGFCMLFRRDLVEKIGLLDETFGSGNYEDDDLCLRASLEGYRNLIAGDVFIHHYGSRSFLGNKIDYNSSMMANRKLFNEKWNGLDAQSPLGKKAFSLKAMEKADELNQKGQNDEAINILIEGIKLSANDRNLYYALTEMLIDLKKYRDALEILNEMPSDNNDIRKLALIGYCKEGVELYEEALEDADHALLFNPTYPLALNLKGILAYKKGDKNTAEGFFKKAIEADPGYGEPYTNLGVLNWVAEQKEEALNFLEKGFILSPTITDIVTAYYSAIINMGEFSRAEMVFREAKGLYPLNRRIAFLLIDLLIQQGKHQKAMENIEEAMIVFGVDDGILKAAIEIRKGIGPKEINVQTKGKSSLSLCMIVKNEEQDLPRCLRSVEPVVDEMIVADTGSTDKTKEIAQAFGAKVYELAWPDSFADARNYSISKASGQWILVMDADEVLSKRDYDRLANTVKNGSPSSLAYSFITRNYVNRSNVEGWRENDGAYSAEEAGIGWFPSQKVRLLPNDKRIRFENPVHEFVEASLSRAGIDIKLGNIIIHHYGKLNEEKSFSKGETYYNLGARKLEEMGSNAYALRELAIQAAELKKYDEAVELWKKIILLQPDNASAYLNLGHSYLELGKYGDALLASKKAMELDPKMKEAVHNYCVCELCSGQVQKVIAGLESLLKRVPGYPSAIGLLGVAYIIAGRTKMGLEYIEKIWKNKTDGSEYLFNTTARLLKAGKTEYAVSLLEAAVESKSVSNALLALREECKKIAEFRNECGQKEKISVPAQV